MSDARVLAALRPVVAVFAQLGITYPTVRPATTAR